MIPILDIKHPVTWLSRIHTHYDIDVKPGYRAALPPTIYRYRLLCI